MRTSDHLNEALPSKHNQRASSRVDRSVLSLLRTHTLRLVTALAILSLCACASSVIVPDGVEIAAVGPAHVLERGDHDGERVVWGGQIVEVENLADRTILVVASYPLDRTDRPRWQQEPGVRFIAEQTGFLEPLTFAPGRFVTIMGTVDGTEQRPVGQFDYRHPKLSTEEIYLWPTDPYYWDRQVRWNLGVGVSL